MGFAVGSQQGVVKIGADDPVDLREGVGAHMGNVACCCSMRGTRAKVDGDAVQGVGIRNLRAAVASGIRSLRAAASGDDIVAAAALERIVDARLDLDVLSVVGTGLVKT